jgi:hypothetical protein
MRGCVAVVTVITGVSGTPKGTFKQFNFERPKILRRKLELAQRGPRVVRTSVQRIDGRVMKRLVGTLLKFEV